MVAAVPSTPGLLLHPLAVCEHINRLNYELKLAPGLLRVAMDVCEKVPLGPLRNPPRRLRRRRSPMPTDRAKARGRGEFGRTVAALTEGAAAAGPLVGVGLTTAAVARWYCIGEDRVRAMIESGELAAINTAPVACGKPRYIVLPALSTAFE